MQPESGRARARRYRFDNVLLTDSQATARNLLQSSRMDCVLVKREVIRAAVFCCPCGCDEVVTINLDPRAGRSWSVRLDERGLTLMPSVRRTTGCCAHFVIWRSEIWWCSDSDDVPEFLSGPEGRAEPEGLLRELQRAWARIRRTT